MDMTGWGMVAATAVLFASTGVVGAQVGASVDYFCTTDAIGGLMYKKDLKKWIGGSLRGDEKFVLSLKFLRSRVEKNALFDKDQVIATYNVSITESGSKN